MANVYGGSGAAPRGCWRTPPDAFKEISWYYGPFDLDAAADEENAKCPDYIDKDMDAMKEPWTRSGAGAKSVWCNPPYSNPGPWLARADDQLSRGNCRRVVMLLPAAVETQWFRDFVRKKVQLVYFGNKAPPFQRSSANYAVLPVTWRLIFWEKRIQFEPPPGVKKSSNPKPSALFIGDARQD